MPANLVKPPHFFGLLAEAAARLNLAFELDPSAQFARLTTDDDRTITVLAGRFPLNLAVGARAAGDKWIAKQLLASAGIPLSPGYRVKKTESWDHLFRAFEELGRDAVIKPYSGERGENVFRCRSEGQVAFAAATIFRISRALIVERFESGREFRVLVLRDEALAVLERVPFEVRGDGASRYVDLLIESEPLLLGRALQDPRLAIPAGGLSFDSVLPIGAAYRPFPSANSIGSTTIVRSIADVPEVIRIAANAARFVGLVYAGIDIIQPDESRPPIVIEVNSAPEIEFDPRKPDDAERAVMVYVRLLEASLER